MGSGSGLKAYLHFDYQLILALGGIAQGLFFGKVVLAIAFVVDQFFGMSISMSFS